MQKERHETQGDVTRPYHGTVMHLNAFRQMDERERRDDIAYAIVLCMLLLVVPIAAGTIATVMGHKALGFALAFASIACGFSLGLFVRRWIIRRFFMVTDVTPWVDLVEVDGQLLGELLRTPMLSFANMCDLPGITFAYNWLLHNKAIAKGTRMELYHLSGSRLVSYFHSNAEADVEILLIPQDKLAITPENERRFWHEFGLLGGKKLDDVIAMIRTEVSDEEHEEHFANKGQNL